MKLKNSVFTKKMNTKILFYSMVIVLISILGSSLVYRQINSQLLFDSISKVNKQTTTYVKSNIESVINSVNSYSKLIIGNENVQSALDEDKGNLLKRQGLLLQLNILMESTPFISDIYLSDMEGNLYVAFKDKKIHPEYLKSAVVDEAIQKNGSYSIHMNGKDFFDNYEGEPFISFSRAVRDLNTQQIIGILVINIPTSYLVSDQKAINDNLIRDLYIVTTDEVIVHTGILDENPDSFHPNLKNINGYITEKTNKNNQDFLVSSYWMEDFDWHIISIISLDQSSNVTDNYKMATAVIIAINLLFIFVGVALFSRLFVRPMKRMVDKIKLNGENLEFIQLDTNIYELNQLEQEYNDMITKIKALIKNKINEQKSLRTKELELLQSQIKPHFLYNTLDTIKLLSKKGENEMAFQAVKALGKFYRSSLGKGEETIRIKDEIDIVTNYMKIQSFRYKDIFELKTYLEPSVADYKILRLILQPLIENALYHGIRPKGESGSIVVKVFKEDEFVKFIVEDDGVGFDVDILSKDYRVKKNQSGGYGVHNTIERLRIYYGDKVQVLIDSQRGIGTKVSINIPENEIMKRNGLGE